MVENPRHLCVASGEGSADLLLALDKRRVFDRALPDGAWTPVGEGPSPAPFVDVAFLRTSKEYAFVFALSEAAILYGIGQPGGIWVPDYPAKPPSQLIEIVGESGDVTRLFGLDIRGDIYTIAFENDQWATWTTGLLPPPPTKLATFAIQGGDDPHLFGIGRDGVFYAIGLLPEATWFTNWPDKPPVPLTRLAVQDGPRAMLVAIDVENDVWALGLPGGTWIKDWPKPPPVAAFDIAVQTGDGDLFIADEKGAIYAIGLPGGEWHEVPPIP